MPEYPTVVCTNCGEVFNKEDNQPVVLHRLNTNEPFVGCPNCLSDEWFAVLVTVANDNEKELH